LSRGDHFRMVVAGALSKVVPTVLLVAPSSSEKPLVRLSQ
jgi:hypothetical protein